MRTIVSTALIIAALAGLFVALNFGSVRARYEMISVALFPNAERAYQYGHRHFQASDPSAYDLELAEYFFLKTRDLDDSHPAVYHQLARTAFLRGGLDVALTLMNIQIARHGNALPSAYYMRGLIQGYRGEYDLAAADYEVFLESHPNNWAAITDYSWVLLKAGRHEEAARATERGLQMFPDNTWLLNTSAIAQYELGNYDLALESARRAADAVVKVTESDWLKAYPGNDPRVAREGIETLRRSVEDNRHMIEAALATSTLQ